MTITDSERRRFDEDQAAGRYIEEMEAKIERLEATVAKQQHELQLRQNKRQDCLACGQNVPFKGAVYCSLKCAEAAEAAGGE